MASAPRSSSKPSKTDRAKPGALFITKLSDLDIDEVSLVPAGANGKDFVLRKERTMKIAALLEAGLEKNDAYTSVLKSLEGDAHDGAEAILKIAQGLKGEIEPKALGEIAKAMGAELPVVEKEVEKIVEVEKAAAPAPKEDPQIVALRKEMEDQKEALRKELETEREALRKERDARVLKEYVEKASSYTVPGLPADKVGAILMSGDNDVPLTKEQVADLRASFAQITGEAEGESALFKNFGNTEVVSGASPTASYNAKVKEIMKSREVDEYEAADIIGKEFPALAASQMSTPRQ